MPTKKLFWDDPYKTECTATVTEINGNRVRLNQTIFYAFSGGQASDEGTMNGIKVVEAKKEGDKENIIDIEYALEKEPDFGVGDTVKVIVDPERRARLRKLHSAIHIVYYLALETLGKVPTIGSDVAPNKAKIEFLLEKPITEFLPIMETATNDFLKQNHAIIMKPDDNKPDLRWWTCHKWKMPCGGTHVKSTSEIGQIILKRVNKGKNKELLEIYLDS